MVKWQTRARERTSLARIAFHAWIRLHSQEKPRRMHKTASLPVTS